MSSNTNLPNKRIRELESRLTACETDTLIAFEVREQLRGGGRGRVLRVGGMWSMAARRYVAGIPADWKPRRYFTAGPNQYAVLLDFFDAMGNDARVAQGLPIIQDILIHGGRRSGKSSALGPCGAMAMVMYPGSLGMILGPRKRHGDRIMAMIRKVLDPSMWTYDRRDASLRLANTSSVVARNAQNYDQEVGDGLRWMVIDEAALLSEAVYDKLSPSLADHNGVCCMSTTPRGHNWVYQKTMKARGGSQAIRDHVFPAADNVFLSDGALRRLIEAAETLSKNGYIEEILGEYVPESDIAFPDFSDDNIRPREQLTEDVTPALCSACFGKPYRFIAAVDFNFTPTAGGIIQMDRNGSAWIVAEVSTSGGAIDAWGQALSDTLRGLGCNDPLNECIVIADASGDYQGVGKNAGFMPGTWETLLAQGWRVEPPTGMMRKNPSRKGRLDLISAMILNAAGVRRLYVDPGCTHTIDMFRGLPIRDGIPSKKSQHIHYYDGATYGIYRIWGTGDGEHLFYKFPLVNSLSQEEVA